MNKFFFSMLLLLSLVHTAHAADEGRRGRHKDNESPRTGTIVFTSTREANVFLDRQPVGTTTKGPFTIKDVPVGQHRLKISKPNYYDYIVSNVLVSAGATTNLGSLSLRPIPGKIIIGSEPAGASVKLDNQNKGMTSNTPLAIGDVPFGPHTIKLSKANYAEYQRHITVGPNETTDLGIIHLTSLVGTILVKSNPTGAIVFLDGQNKGVTSNIVLTITDVSPGTHTLKIAKQGHVDYIDDNVVVRSGGVNGYDIVLDPNPGIILVGSAPGGAEVRLNGALKGTTPETGQTRVLAELLPGEYSRTFVVNLSKTGHIPYNQRVTVASDQNVDLGVIPLTQERNFLWVGSIPPGSMVFFGEAGRNMTERGHSSLSIGGLTPGTRYRVRVQREGFRESIREYVQGVGGMFIFIRLEPQPRTQR